MEAAEISPEPATTSSSARAVRAVALIAVSLIIIAAAGALFMQPKLFTAVTSPGPVRAQTAYRIGSVVFVDRDVGWVVANFDFAGYAVLHTVDGGRTWTKQLSARTGGHAAYLKFFNQAEGVFALLGSRPVLQRTRDGGGTWTTLPTLAGMPALSTQASALSWSFVDADHGWMLATKDASKAPSLYRTEDGGKSWSDLGPPVAPPDQAFGIQFSYLTTGWLATAGAGPYAYKTGDSGATWSRVPIPARVGFPRRGRFFVDVQQTARRGAIASVVAFTDFMGRTSSSGAIRRFPPLAVPFYDGSRPNNYVYQTMINQVVGGPFSAVQAPRSELASSVDNGASWSLIEPPSSTGTIGYADASHWWWINTGVWSSSADAGVTWTQRRTVSVLEPMPGTLQMLDRSHAWLAGSSSATLQATSDGGLHWRRLDLPPLEVIPTP